VLDAQRSLFDAEISETGAVRDQFVSLIQLYKALGGGWPQAPESEPEEKAQDKPAGTPNEAGEHSQG
jgi:multidrug efflux system outer membrane protein